MTCLILAASLHCTSRNKISERETTIHDKMTIMRITHAANKLFRRFLYIS